MGLKIDIKQLKALALDATSGEWTVQNILGNSEAVYSDSPTGCDDEDDKTYLVCIMPNEYGGNSCQWNRGNNSKFIAAANPETILALIKRIEKLEKVARVAKQAASWMTLDGCSIDHPLLKLRESLEELEE